MHLTIYYKNYSTQNAYCQRILRTLFYNRCMEFKDRLKELRTEKGYTQKDIAEVLGLSKTGYAGYEQGYREPDLKTLIKISKAFGVSTDYLLGLTD